MMMMIVYHGGKRRRGGGGGIRRRAYEKRESQPPYTPPYSPRSDSLPVTHARFAAMKTQPCNPLLVSCNLTRRDSMIPNDVSKRTMFKTHLSDNVGPVA